MTDGFGVSAQSCTYGAWLKVHLRCTCTFSFDQCWRWCGSKSEKHIHDITIDPRYSLDLTIKFFYMVAERGIWNNDVFNDEFPESPREREAR